MGLATMLILFLTSLQFFQLSQSATVVVDGVSEWKDPQVHIGDSVVFEHKYQYNLYIFKNQDAFNLCNFAQATLLTKPNSTSYTWRTSRPGFFYFSFSNGSNEACLKGQKFAVKVSPPSPVSSPELPPPAAAPLPSTGGGIVASSPAFPWPFQPHESDSPSPAPGGSSLSDAAGPAAPPPDKKGIPLINSNPAVPLPTGEVDSATIRPLPTSGCQHFKQVVGFSGVQTALISCFILLTMMVQ